MAGRFDGAPRPLRPGDAAPVRALVREALGDTAYLGRLLELVALAERADPESEALVIERGGVLAALALFGGVAGAQDVWRLHTVLIAPQVSLREAGDPLVAALVQRVRALNGRMLVAELPADPAYGTTLSLLRANDFDQEGRLEDYFRDGVALLFLRRDL